MKRRTHNMGQKHYSCAQQNICIWNQFPVFIGTWDGKRYAGLKHISLGTKSLEDISDDKCWRLYQLDTDWTLNYYWDCLQLIKEGSSVKHMVSLVYIYYLLLLSHRKYGEISCHLPVSSDTLSTKLFCMSALNTDETPAGIFGCLYRA